MLAECTMFRPVKPLKSRNMTLLSASLSTLIPQVVGLLLLEAGIRLSRFEMNPPLGADPHLPSSAVLGYSDAEPGLICYSPRTLL